MSTWSQKVARGLLVMLLLTLLVSGSAAAPASQFIPPVNITVQMYTLYEGGSLYQPLTPCTSGNTSWGCTAFCNNYPYPGPCSSPSRPYTYTTSTVAVSIENDYLLDVIPQEMNPAIFHPNAIYAQAIAARTYAYYHIYYTSTINNSTSFQVFVPYKFESLFPATDPNIPSTPCASTNLNISQRTVCDATASRLYITHYITTTPAFTEFFSDRQYNTVSNPGFPYLLGVADPISIYPTDPDIDGHGRGLSQYGASRWARGNTCGDTRYTCAPWSVQWLRYEQILTHYYTAIHIRDANGTPLTPEYRWNALSQSVPSPMYYQSYVASIRLQNTSAYTWDSYYYIGYRWLNTDGSPVSETYAASRVAVGALAPGADGTYTVSVQPPTLARPRPLILQWDMVYAPLWNLPGYWFRDAGWPTQDATVCVGGYCQAFLPLVLRNYPLRTDLVQNGGFEAGQTGWTLSGNDLIATKTPRSGSYSAYLGSDINNDKDDWLYQTVTIPSDAISADLNYWWYMHTTEGTYVPPYGPYDYLSIQVRDANGVPLETLQTIHHGSEFTRTTWVQSPSFSLLAYRGQSVQLYFHGVTDYYSNPTAFFVDDVSLMTCR